jgi:hypothetical protein
MAVTAPIAATGAAVASTASSLSNLAGGGGPSPAGQTTNTSLSTRTPYQAPQYDQLLGSANNFFVNGYLNPATMTENFAPTTEAQNQGIQSLINTAQAGSPLIGTAQNLIQGTAAGNYLDKGNPYFGAAFQNISDAIRPTIDSAFESAGRYGSGAAANAKADALTQAGANLAYGNYNTERQNQINAALASPGIAQSSFLFPQALYNAGTLQQQQEQARINAANQLEQFNADSPYTATARFKNLISGDMGGSATGSASQPFFGPDPTASLLGAGLGGLGIYNGLSNMSFPTNSFFGPGSYSDMLGGSLGTSVALGANPFPTLFGNGQIPV